MSEPDLLDMLRALIHLTEDEREAFIDHTLVGRSYREIGDDLGIGGERARQLAQQAETKLALALNKRRVA